METSNWRARDGHQRLPEEVMLELGRSDGLFRTNS